jgi:hypothetical protein
MPISKPTRTIVSAVAVGVFCVAFLLRAGIGCRAITFDEADYTWAAVQGFLANWLDRGDINLTRHFHGPLLAYVIRVAVALGGYSTAWIRMPGVVASAATAGLVALAIYDLATGSPRTRAVLAAFGGLLQATAPASITMSGLARPQPFVELLLVCNVWLFCRYLRAPSARAAAAFGVSLGLQFVLMEYGFVVLAAVVAAAALVRLSDRRRVGELRHVAVATAAWLGTVLVLWPPGLVRLRSVRNLSYYMQYAERGQLVPFRGALTQHVPWWAYAYWYWTDHPMLLVFIVGIVVLVPVWMYAVRSTTALAAGTFALVMLAAVHRAHIMTMAYSCFAVPSLVIAGVLAIGWLWTEIASRPSILSVTCRCAVGLLAVAAILDGPDWPRRDAPCTSDTGLTRISRILAENAAPGDVVLASQWPVVRWVLFFERERRDVEITPYDPSSQRGSELAMESLRSGRFTWMLAGERSNSRFPNAPLLRFVAEHWPAVARDEGSVLYRNPEAPGRVTTRTPTG